MPTWKGMNQSMPRVNFGFDAQSVQGEHLFLSYSRGDAGRIRGIALELHRMGLPIWYDNGLIPGNLWKKEILREVKQSRMTVFFLTKDLFRRDRTFMIEEYQFAKDHNKSRVCIWLDDIGNMDCTALDDEMYLWWSELSKLQSIEVFHLQSDAERAKEIYEGICRNDIGFRKYAVSKPTSQPVQTAWNPAPRLNLQVGDRYQFGQYPQGANGEVKPIEWRVLAVANGRALLIADKLLDCVKYHEKDTDVTWETCTLRKWMNWDFINKAFSTSEQAQIAMITNQNPDNPNGGFFGHKRINGGNATQDKIFALSIDEVNKYFSNDDDRMAAPTGYAKKQGAYVGDSYSLPSGEKTRFWWLRSPGDNSNRAAFVFFDGLVDHCGYRVNDGDGAVRPAFWLNLE